MMTEEQVREAIRVINEECRARIDDREARSLIHYFTKSGRDGREWRFQGALGFGGKLRVNSNRECPYVDCYSEDVTAERFAMIEKANARLAQIVLSPSRETS